MGIMTKEEWDGIRPFELLRCPICEGYYFAHFGLKCDVCQSKLERVDSMYDMILSRGLRDVERMTAKLREHYEEYPESSHRDDALKTVEGIEKEIGRLKRTRPLRHITNQEDD